MRTSKKHINLPTTKNIFIPLTLGNESGPLRLAHRKRYRTALLPFQYPLSDKQQISYGQKSKIESKARRANPPDIFIP